MAKVDWRQVFGKGGEKNTAQQLLEKGESRKVGGNYGKEGKFISRQVFLGMRSVFLLEAGKPIRKERAQNGPLQEEVISNPFEGPGRFSGGSGYGNRGKKKETE